VLDVTLHAEADHKRGAVSSRVRYDIQPEDVFDQDTLHEVARKQDEAEANIASRLADEHAFDNALTPDDLRRRAQRVLQGEDIATLYGNASHHNPASVTR